MAHKVKIEISSFRIKTLHQNGIPSMFAKVIALSALSFAGFAESSLDSSANYSCTLNSNQEIGPLGEAGVCEYGKALRLQRGLLEANCIVTAMGFVFLRIGEVEEIGRKFTTSASAVIYPAEGDSRVSLNTQGKFYSLICKKTDK